MNADVRRLVDLLVQSQGGAGAHLTPRDVDIALLAALRAHAGRTGPQKIEPTRLMFRIELMDEQGWPQEELAVAGDDLIARAVFDAAVKQRPGRKISLRLGARIVAKTE